jgi:hypothetical protein
MRSIAFVQLDCLLPRGIERMMRLSEAFRRITWAAAAAAME